MTALRLSLALSALTAVACSQTVQVKPVPFARSEAFKGVRQNALGFLDYDFTGDGVPDAVAVVASGPGMAPRVFVQEPSEQGAQWSEACTGPVILGEELDTLRWIEPGPRKLLLVVASTENPDILTQSFALFPESAPCTPIFQETIRMARPGYDVVSPGEVPGGVLVDESDRVHVIDKARTVHLNGAAGEVEVLTAVRERVFDDDGRKIKVSEPPRSFILPRKVRARWVSAKEDTLTRDVPELVDEDAKTSFTATAGDNGLLEIDSTEPITILDVSHMCDGTTTRIEITPEQLPEDTHVIGDKPNKMSFIHGVGRRPQNASAERREVLVLREPATHLALHLGPIDSDRCLRDVRAYGFIAQ